MSRQAALSREDFTEEQKEIFGTVRNFAREKILSQRDALSKLDWPLTKSVLQEAAGLGITGVDVAEAYGGLGLDRVTSALVAEGLTTGQCASFMTTFLAHTGIGTLPIVYFGTPAQKEKYIPKLVSVEMLSAYALTEPEAGSDALAMRSTAVPAEDGAAFLLSGRKQFITNAGWADLFIVFAKIGGKDTAAFLVEKGFPGLSVGPEEHKMGIQGSSTCSVVLDNCRVPKENLLGEPGKGHEIAFNILNVGRFKLGAADLGGTKTTLDTALAYAMERKQFATPIAFFDPIRWKFAQMAALAFALDAAVYRTVGLMDARIASLDAADPAHGRKALEALEEYAIEASICKVFGSEALSEAADEGIQVFGGYGFSEEYPLARVARDNRVDRIFEGTNEINRMVIYGYFLRDALTEKLPIREEAGRWNSMDAPVVGPLAWEGAAIERARRIILRLFERAVVRYGQDLRNEGMVGEPLADLLIGLYAGSSAFLRAARTGRREHALALRIYLARFIREIHGTLPLLLPAVFEPYDIEKEGRPLLEAASGLNVPFNIVEEVRRLTDLLYHRRGYFLD
jgi:alkylation response protein AidB-like acyl-CoA dehydrogenase